MIMAPMAQHSAPLIDDVSHGSTLCPPSIMMAPMDQHSVPIIDDVSHGSIICPTSVVMAPHYVPLKDDGSHVSLQYVSPKLLWLPWIHNLSHPIMMAPMSPFNLYPLNDNGYLMMKRSLDLSLDHPPDRQFFLLPIW